MAAFRFRGFGGERPVASPRALEAHQAQIALNTRFDRGTLRSFRDMAVVQPLDVSGAQSLFRYKAGNVWFQWAADVDAVKSPISNDAYDRVFFTGYGGYPRVTYNAIAGAGAPNSYQLGVPAPSTAPIGTVGGTPNDPTSAPETRFYIVLYEDIFGGLHAPSPVSNQCDVRIGQTVTLSLPGAPSGNFNVPYKQIFRTNTAGQTGVFQFVARVSVGTTQYVDSILPGALGEALPAEIWDWDMPPTDLVGLVEFPGEVLVGFRKNELCASEPGMPHIFPVSYRRAVEHNIVAIGVFENTVVAATTGVPYLFSGVHPASFVRSRLPVAQACVSKAGLVSSDYGVIYPSPDGLMLIGPGRVELITAKSFNREKWQALNPTSMRGAMWEGLYLAFYQVDGVWKTLAIDPSAGGEVVFVDVPLGTGIGGRYYDLEDDTLYVTSQGYIQKWGGGSERGHQWLSRPVDLPQPASIAVARVRAQKYPVTLALYADDAHQDTVVVSNDEPVRLGGANLADVYEVEITGTGETDEVQLASTIEELKQIE